MKHITRAVEGVWVRMELHVFNDDRSAERRIEVKLGLLSWLRTWLCMWRCRVRDTSPFSLQHEVVLGLLPFLYTLWREMSGHLV